MSATTYELRDVSVVRAGSTVLQVETLDIAAKTVTCIVGPNGSGKSTLLQLLAFLIHPDRGRVSFQGNRVDFERDLTELRRRATLVAQEPLMLQRSVRANLRYGLRQRGIRDDEAVDRALARVGLPDFAPRDARSLSGGEAQRVAIARAIVLSTDVVLLDEPTSSVDRGTHAAIEEIVRQLARGGSTVVLSTHDLDQARRVGDRIIGLDRGAIVSLQDSQSEIDR